MQKAIQQGLGNSLWLTASKKIGLQFYRKQNTNSQWAWTKLQRECTGILSILLSASSDAEQRMLVMYPALLAQGNYEFKFCVLLSPYL